MTRRRTASCTPPGPAWDALYPTLDLHGLTAEEARRATEHWLRARQADGAATVRVITGRGLHSAGLPVLPGEIRDLLHALTGALVQRFAPEPGGGVIRIELARRKGEARQGGKPAPPRQRPRLTLDAALRRRAEEALWELGIDPTPELVEIEARRIAAQHHES